MSSVPRDEPPPPRLSRWRFFSRSFRIQATVWNTFTILLFTIAALIGLRYGLSFTLLREEDKLLAEDATEVTLLVKQFAPHWDQVGEELERKAESHAPRRWFGQVRDLDGNILASSREVPSLPLIGSAAPSPRTNGSFRITERQYSPREGQAFQIVVGATTEEIEEDVARFTQLVLIASVFLLILAPLGGFWLAGRVIRPLADMIARTSKLRPSNINERLPIRQTGDELDQLAITINSMLDRIADYLARHRDLTANAAHELRSPLAAMLSTAEVALNQDRSAEEYKDLLGTIVEECLRLGSLVQQLLLLAESDAGRLQPRDEPVRLDEIAAKTVEMFRGVAEHRGLILELHTQQATISADSGHLRQIVGNLIDNAIKFTTKGTVKIEVSLDESGSRILKVTDTGAGISPEHLPHVFDRFYRGEQARSRLTSGGTGLGLSICKALASANGGSIDIESSLGVGTVIRVVFLKTD